MSQQFSHSEWVLNLIVEIDKHHPGFCGEFFRASAERRQVIAAFLSACPPAPPQASEVARVLISADHGAILAKAYQEAPKGLRGALRRAGPLVHDEHFYSILHKSLSKPAHNAVPTTIARLPTIDQRRVMVANILPERICRANVVEALSDVAAASDLVVAIKLLVAAGADEEQLTASICGAKGAAGLAKAMKAALLRCRAPKHPVPTSDFYRPITTAQELHSAAIRFRNCAKNYTIEFLDEEAGHAFGQAQLGNESAVVHLRRRSGQWQIEGVFGPRNYRPSSALRDQVYSYLASQGVEARERANAKSEWEPVRRITSNPIFGLDFE